MEKIYRDSDVDLKVLGGRTIAVIGYGIQGKVQAANARDSGCTVIVGTRPPEQSTSRKQAQADGFTAMSIAEATAKADILLIELADPAQPALYKSDIEPHLKAGQTLCFCHGFNVLYGAIRPPENVNTVLFVPNAPGAFVREKYKKGEGVYGCVSIEHDATGDARADRPGHRQGRGLDARRRGGAVVPARDGGRQLRGADPLRRRHPAHAGLLPDHGRATATPPASPMQRRCARCAASWT